MAKYSKPAAPIYPTDTIFAAACYADRVNAGEYIKYAAQVDSTGTMSVTNRELMARALEDQSVITQADRDAGEAVRKYYHTLTFKVLRGQRLSEFDNTAMLLANKEQSQGSYDIAIAASLPSCQRRAATRDQADAKVNFAQGGLIGKVGDKVSAKVEIVKCVFSQQWNVFFLTGLTDKDQPVFFAFKKQVAPGTQMNIQGTVKAHRDNSTQLNRVRAVV